MLTDLTIRNIAIIENLHLSLQSGLTVLTGETGAGKSIIIDAVGLIMGGRASADLIRSGCDEATVEAIFHISDCPDINQALEQAGLEGGDELLIKRTISRAGKNRVFINGSLATLALLEEIASRLINIYGQHESQTLLRLENQLLLLDSFAGTTALREEFTAVFRSLAEVHEQLETIEAREQEAARRLDLLSFQSEEIETAALRPGEDAELEERRQLLAGAEKLGTVSGEAYEALYGGDGALLGQLRRIGSAVRDIAAIDHSLSEVASTLEESYLQLEDAAVSLRSYASRIEADPAALQQVDDRIDLLNRLKRKYGATLEEVLEFKERIDRELEDLRGHALDRGRLEQDRERLRSELEKVGRTLSDHRTIAAGELQQKLETEAHQLAMKGAVIEPALEILTEPRATGCERVEFLFSPNPGEPPRPLAKIASGGELSRLMLAMKQVLPESDVPTLVFDEVDTGISGATSELVGRKLKNVAARQQVLCITHLPQVAACATQHLRVEKQICDGRTTTSVTQLEPHERTGEIARMLAGEKISESALAHAAEMLAAAASQG